MSNNKKRKKSNEDLAFSEAVKIMKKDFKKMVDDMGDDEFIILVSIIMHYVKTHDIFDDDYEDVFDFEDDDYEEFSDEDFGDEGYENIFDEDFKNEEYEDIFDEDEMETNTKKSHHNRNRNNNICKFPFNDEDFPF